MTYDQYIAQFKIAEEKSKETTVWIIRLNNPGSMSHNCVLSSGLTKEAIDWTLHQAFRSMATPI